MSTNNRPESRTRQITLAASMSAVYFILRSVPTFQMIGIPGSARFTAGDFILTSIALVCGPWSGILSVLIGTILAYEAPLGYGTPIFLGLDFLPAVTNVAISALLLKGRYRIAQALYIAALVGFVLSPYSLLFGFGYVPYAWLHLVALVVILSPLAAKVPSLLKRGGLWRTGALGAIAFVGTMGQHLVGGLLFELVVGFIGGFSPTKFMNYYWRVIFWLYPGERIIIVIISTLIALAVYRSLKRVRP